MITVEQRLAFVKWQHNRDSSRYKLVCAPDEDYPMPVASQWYQPKVGSVLPANDVRQYVEHQGSRSEYQPSDDAVFCGQCHQFLCHSREVLVGAGAGFTCPSCGAVTRL